MADEESFRVRFVVQGQQLDGRTVNAMCRFERKTQSTYLHTIRTYQEPQLPRHLHKITNAINNVAVAKSKYVDVSSSGLTRVFFRPFYKHSFKEWKSTLAGEIKTVKEMRIRKMFRCIVRALDLIYGHHRYDIGLEGAIRVDDEDNCQIVLDTEGTDSMQVGVPKDLAAFKNLVDRTFGMITGANLPYQLFDDLYRYFGSLSDKFDENGKLRSFAYFIFHNPLFYEVKDRYNCVYKMKMFRDLHERDFDNAMSSMNGLKNWLKRAKKNPIFNQIYFQKPIGYKTDGSILEFLYNMYHHGLTIGQGITEIQQQVDLTFPCLINILFLYFVLKIESKKVFCDVGVLDYFRSVYPSPDLLE